MDSHFCLNLYPDHFQWIIRGRVTRLLAPNFWIITILLYKQAKTFFSLKDNRNV